MASVRTAEASNGKTKINYYDEKNARPTKEKQIFFSFHNCVSSSPSSACSHSLELTSRHHWMGDWTQQQHKIYEMAVVRITQLIFPWNWPFKMTAYYVLNYYYYFSSSLGLLLLLLAAAVSSLFASCVRVCVRGSFFLSVCRIRIFYASGHLYYIFISGAICCHVMSGVNASWNDTKRFNDINSATPPIHSLCVSVWQHIGLTVIWSV